MEADVLRVGKRCAYIDHYHLKQHPIYLTRERYRQISLARKKKPSRSCEAMKQRLMGPPRNLLNWRSCTPIAPLTKMMVTLAGSDVVRCRNRLRMLHTDWKLERLVMWFQPTVVYIWCSGLVELGEYTCSVHPKKKECIFVQVVEWKVVRLWEKIQSLIPYIMIVKIIDI